MFIEAAKNFEIQLLNLINNCGLTVSEAYYIVENAALQLKIAYLESLHKESLSPGETQEYNVEIPVNQNIKNNINGEKGEQENAE